MPTSHHFGWIWLIALALSSGATAAMPQATGDSLVESIQSCDAALSADGLDLKRMLADGWSEARAKADGKDLSLSLGIYDRKGVLLLRPATDKTIACMLSTAAKDMTALRALVQSIVAKFGKPVSRMNDGSLVFKLPSGNLSMVTGTGNPQNPALRVGVVFVTKEQK